MSTSCTSCYPKYTEGAKRLGKCYLWFLNWFFIVLESTCSTVISVESCCYDEHLYAVKDKRRELLKISKKPGHFSHLGVIPAFNKAVVAKSNNFKRVWASLWKFSTDHKARLGVPDNEEVLAAVSWHEDELLALSWASGAPWGLFQRDREQSLGADAYYGTHHWTGEPARKLRWVGQEWAACTMCLPEGL